MKGNMKQICCLFLINIFISLGYTFEITDMEGIWNICDKSEKNFYISTIPQGSFYRTITSIVIVKNDDEGFQFLVQGGKYLLTNIIKRGNDINFSAEYDDYIFEKENVLPHTFHASVILHVIDQNTIWFEIDQKKSDPLFWKHDFNGKELVYWRAKKVENNLSQ